MEERNERRSFANLLERGKRKRISTVEKKGNVSRENKTNYSKLKQKVSAIETKIIRDEDTISVLEEKVASLENKTSTDGEIICELQNQVLNIDYDSDEETMSEVSNEETISEVSNEENTKLNKENHVVVASDPTWYNPKYTTMDIKGQMMDFVSTFRNGVHVNEKIYFTPESGNVICVLDIQQNTCSTINIK